MACLVIGCELKRQSTCEPVWAALESWGAVRLLESTWLLDTRMDAAYVCSALDDLIESQDSVAIIELRNGADWSALRASPEAADWLRRNIGNGA
jgi:hypothetical protein